jgi:hypothetical protein
VNVSPPGRTHGSAFGLALECEFALAGLVGSGARAESGAVRVTRAPADRLRERFADRELERLAERRRADGTLVSAIDRDAERGYRFHAPGFATCAMTPSASLIDCALQTGEAWRWQRYLAAQVLPFASAIRGFEVFHASAVELDGRAVAFVGPSGSGKSTLALRLAAAGAGLLTDDVLAVDGLGEALVAHPAVGQVKVRPTAGAPAPTDAIELGAEPDARLYSLRALAPPALLDRLCLLRVSSVERPRLRPASGPSAGRLLASTFNFVLATRERLVNQLEVCSRISREAEVYELELPSRIDDEHAAEVLAELADRPTGRRFGRVVLAAPGARN